MPNFFLDLYFWDNMTNAILNMAGSQKKLLSTIITGKQLLCSNNFIWPAVDG